MPNDPVEAEAWARRWAEIRVAEKRQRNFAEADRIRGLLRTNGWEVRDTKDGTIELVRIARPGGS
jgi:cysteinyl-tRNA synthetase